MLTTRTSLSLFLSPVSQSRTTSRLWRHRELLQRELVLWRDEDERVRRQCIALHVVADDLALPVVEEHGNDNFESNGKFANTTNTYLKN